MSDKEEQWKEEYLHNFEVRKCSGIKYILTPETEDIICSYTCILELHIAPETPLTVRSTSWQYPLHSQTILNAPPKGGYGVLSPSIVAQVSLMWSLESV